MKINWRQKLSSRKLHTALIAWLTSVLTAFNIPESAIGQVALILSGIGALVVYVLAEGSADKARVEHESIGEDN